MSSFTGGFESKIIERIVKELQDKKITQKDLLSWCKESGINISQPSLSKIFSGEKKPNLVELTAISKVVGKPIDYFVWGDEYKEDFCDIHDSAILHNSGEELNIYKGDFHVYFLSTAVCEDKILHGILHVKEEHGLFCLELDIHTGVKDGEGKRNIKKYTGRILSCSGPGVAYLIFKSESIGEISMICLRHRNYTTMQQVECRVGLALTMSAGEKKEPVAHRCLLVRNELDGDEIEKLRPWLYMISDEIRIQRDKWEKLIGTLKERYPDHEMEIRKVEQYAMPKEYVEFDAGVLQKQFLAEHEALEVLSELYRAADKEKNYMIFSDDDIRVYNRIAEAEKEGTESLLDSG